MGHNQTRYYIDIQYILITMRVELPDKQQPSDRISKGIYITQRSHLQLPTKYQYYFHFVNKLG